MLRVLTVAVVGGAFLLTTADRVHDWTDERRLWFGAVAVSPEKPRPWINLGNIYSRMNAGPLAQHAYETALTLSESRPMPEREIGAGLASANLALMAADRGDYWQARYLVGMAPQIPAVQEVGRWLARVSSH